MSVLLIIAVGLAVAMLVWVNAIVQKHQRPALGVAGVCFLLSGAPWFWAIYSIPLAGQALLLVFMLPLASLRRRGPATYRIASVTVAALIWMVVGANLVGYYRQLDRWALQVPYEPLGERLPEPKPSGASEGTLPSEWNQLELELGQIPWFRRRESSLRAVHVYQTQLFHRAAGFGAGRMFVFDPREEHFAPDPTPPVPQPEEYEPGLVSLGDKTPEEVQLPLDQLHTNSLLDFVNPDGWGYVKSRAQVAGFRPHRFSQVPAPVRRWEVRRVELIGLLLHEKPVVYVSEHLPRMDELRGATTREPDSFESDGLTAIRGGDILYHRGSGSDVRMVGAIRSVHQCVECHGGQRGDLLGAFSYQLRRGGVR